ncbi:MAG: HNH endonuclease, partial [Mycobacterium sp.]
VNVVISDQALFGAQNGAAAVVGYGSVPSAVAQNLIAQAVGDPESLATLRRLYATPATGTLVAMESRSRIFPKGLSAFIELRDQRCRTPYCDAPIRHRDHAQPHRRGGATSAENGLGLCERCNYTKEVPGWEVSAGTDGNDRHIARFTTPTGAHHHSLAPPAPGTPRTTMSEIEVYLNNRLIA